MTVLAPLSRTAALWLEQNNVYGGPLQDFLDSFWGYLYTNWREWLVSPLFDASLGLVYYFAFTLPFLALDLWRPQWSLGAKVQPDKMVRQKDYFNCLKNLFFNQVVFVFPLSALKYLDDTQDAVPEAPPKWHFMLAELFFIFFLFDFLFYLSHRALHFRFLYKHVHRIHHEYHSPFAWVTQYLHPVELLMVGISGALCPFLFGSHIFTNWFWMLLITLTSVEHHCGFELPFPFNPHALTFGLYAGSTWHDLHHRFPNTNYCAFFCIWDRITGAVCDDDYIRKKTGGDKNGKTKKAQ